MAVQDQIKFKNIQSASGKVGYEETVPVEDVELSRSFEVEKDIRILEIKLSGNRQFLELQRDWAAYIRWQIWAVLFFQFLFVLLIGFDVGGFTDHISKIPYAYMGVILQNLANIIALGLVVAQFLFPKNNDVNNLK